MSELDNIIRQLERACRQLLEEHPAGLSEHALLQALRREPYELMPTLALDDSLGLFRSHFLLFHVLYRLRDSLRGDRLGDVAISALKISLEPYSSGEYGLQDHDPLHEYYLDLQQLSRTGEEKVEALLESFWRGLVPREEREVALAVLELEVPVTLGVIKRQYRRLAMRYHPDRGGDAGRMHELNDALATLQRYYR